MAISDYKITAEDIAKYGCVSLPDTLTGNAQENKAKFDRLVRECVANAVNAVIDNMVLVENEAQDWASAEALRVQAEAARVAAENLRVQAENDRADAETARANAENKRDTAEKSRAAAETGRVNAESARVTAESQRANAESSRAQNEAARVSAETGRADAEADRVSAEDTRIANENARKSAETDRASAETVRESGENARKSAEKARASAEQQRANAESTRQTNETARVSAEKSRVAAETARQTAEKARNVWEAYSASKAYVPGNKVSFGGSSYVCTATTTGHAPTDTAYWLLIAKKGEDGKGAGDMLAATYDPQGKKQDVFAYTDRKIAAIPTPDVSGQIETHNTAADAHAEKFAKYLPLAGGTMTGQIVGAKATENVPTVVSQKTPTETGRSTALILQSGDDTDYNYSGIGVYDATAKKYLIPVGVIAFDGDGTVGRLISEDSKRTALGHVSVAPWGIDIGHTSGGVTIKNVVEPTEDTMPTPKSYVDNAIGNLTPSAHKVTLSTSGWNSSTKQQTVNCADVVADETAQQILPMPATASMAAYNDAGIQCVAQAAGTLTFQCETVPTAAIDVYVTITPVAFS